MPLGGNRTARIASGFMLDAEQRDALSAAGGTAVLDDAAAQESAAVRAVAEQDVNVWFGPGLTPAVLASAGGLEWLQTASVGVEYFMFDALAESDVVITNMCGSHTATAEHALAMMLALARGLRVAAVNQTLRQWQAPSPDDVRSLYGSTVLVIGTGQIGTGVARRAAAFDAVVEGVNRTGRDAGGHFSKIHPVDRLSHVVAAADWIVNACPLTPQTVGLLSAEVLGQVRPGSMFVNVGRGKTVDQPALVEALSDGRIRSAALDVFADEPLPADDVLWSLPNVFVTPHSAGVIPGSTVLELGVRFLLANLPAGSPFPDAVDKRLGY